MVCSPFHQLFSFPTFPKRGEHRPALLGPRQAALSLGPLAREEEPAVELQLVIQGIGQVGGQWQLQNLGAKVSVDLNKWAARYICIQ